MQTDCWRAYLLNYGLTGRLLKLLTPSIPKAQLSQLVRAAAITGEQRPAEAIVSLRLASASSRVTVTAFAPTAADVVVLSVVSTAAVDVRAQVWTYSGCAGPRKPVLGAPAVGRFRRLG